MKQSKSRFLNMITGMAGVAMLTCLDQFTKYLAIKYLKDQSDVELIPGVFELTYLENRGAAWGLFVNMQWLFLLAMVFICTVVIFYYVKSIPHKKYRTFRMLCVMLVAGGVGNAIDRVINGFVVDFLYVSLINFPVFNVADCYVTISVALFLLIYRKEVAEWIRSE